MPAILWRRTATRSGAAAALGVEDPSRRIEGVLLTEEARQHGTVWGEGRALVVDHRGAKEALGVGLVASTSTHSWADGGNPPPSVKVRCRARIFPSPMGTSQRAGRGFQMLVFVTFFGATRCLASTLPPSSLKSTRASSILMPSAKPGGLSDASTKPRGWPASSASAGGKTAKLLPRAVRLFGPSEAMSIRRCSSPVVGVRWVARGLMKPGEDGPVQLITRTCRTRPGGAGGGAGAAAAPSPSSSGTSAAISQLRSHPDRGWPIYFASCMAGAAEFDLVLCAQQPNLGKTSHLHSL